MSMTRCEACDRRVERGDMVFDAVDGGVVHAKCLGWPAETDPDGFVDEDGNALDARPDPYAFAGD